MVVSFKNVQQLARKDASPIRSGSNALGPTTATDPLRPTLYDPTWGYFVFGQSIGFEYGEVNDYQDTATFRINGIFDRSAEFGDHGTESDDQAFARMASKYAALEALFNNAAQAKAPTAYSLWGSGTDARCIPLPSPLVSDDLDHKTLYALPQSIRIEKTQWPNLIRYQAILKEANPPAAKLILNDILIDNGTVNITLPQPVLSRHAMVGTSGEVMQLRHYKTMEMEISGSLPLDVGRVAGDEVAALALSLENGKVSLDVAVRGTASTVISHLWSDLAIVADPGVDMEYQNRVARISIQARE